MSDDYQSVILRDLNPYAETPEELDKIDLDLYDNKKTQSQRLRSVLFLNWQKDNKGFSEFKEYYVMQMNTIIEHFKGKLE